MRGGLARVVILLALAGTGLAETVQHQSQNQVSSSGTCPAENIWEVEGRVFREEICLETQWGPELHVGPEAGRPVVGNYTAGVDSAQGTYAGAVVSDIETETETGTGTPQEAEQDTDSLLDSASFLSFEDWKKQNLAKVGQSAENVGGSRRVAAAGKEGRRQPGINNALDSLGDDAEIELEFGGFGAETPEANDEENDARVRQVHRADVSRRKDAGTTCKERFNYASFDCAATVLKTNRECKGSSSVLVENKDSYMLNECRAQNKFLILELCDDILVDTVVLANYEFFSSIFHTFRVSVSDRYPAKPDQWKELGVYEGRNTREVQAFAVENSLIWARYLRIEFLTHYGHEFFCPISLIRVHGTTMMEEYKHDESAGRAETDDIDEAEAEVEVEEAPVNTKEELVVPPVDVNEPMAEQIDHTPLPETCPQVPSEVELLLLGISQKPDETCDINQRPPPETIPEGTTSVASANVSSTATMDGAPAAQSGASAPPKAADDTRKPGDSTNAMMTTPDASVAPAEVPQQNSTVESTGKSAGSSKEDNSPPPESIRPTSTQPPSSNPTTQESFFKSVNKRLQMLESNSTLSLLYIEEQSRILRDAFNKVEKRQLAKTSTFLETLNVTVLSELKEFREQYDHVWNSVAFEFEHQRMRYHSEVHALSAQLGVLADELVFQKRVTIIQSIMVLCCFALVLFSRGSVGNYMEFPRVQRMVARSYSLRDSSPISASLSASPGSTRPTSSYRENETHRRNLSDSSSSQDSPASQSAPYIPPTPTSPISQDMRPEKSDEPPSPESMSVPTLGTPHFRSHSTPPVLNGHPSILDRDEEGDDFALPAEVSQTSDEGLTPRGLNII
ncbi:hypothetical protein N7456_011469 [Penicillium angulare]|uniref:SUN domain-containing protein n=1 Tax=Penicillium angulare TaxID=116970 RepID=A0A9W9JZV7_9EURO|nr:hypothetical protein N7456_011469 [Penicillium angulare]